LHSNLLAHANWQFKKSLPSWISKFTWQDVHFFWHWSGFHGDS
jgi:hypothetical protein